MKTKRFPRLHDDELPILEKKGTFLLESVGLEPTPNPPTPVFSRDPKALPTELRLRHTCFFQQIFYLIIPLMIRMTTELIPSGFLAYNQLLNALTGLMVIADIIMIRKLI